MFQPDVYEFTIEFSKKVDYSLVTVSSKAGSNETLPFRTTCWGSAETIDDLSKQKLFVSAKVEQGNRPVINAKVEWVKSIPNHTIFLSKIIFRALIAKENTDQPIRLKLLDDASGADLVSNDGIYSRYFTQYENGETRYSLKCQVKGKYFIKWFLSSYSDLNF